MITAICNLRTWPRLYLEVNQVLKHLRRPTSSFSTCLCDCQRFKLQTAMGTHKYITAIFLLFITESLVSWGSVMMRSYFMDAFFFNSGYTLPPISTHGRLCLYNIRHHDTRFVNMKEEALFKMNRRPRHSNDTRHTKRNIKATNKWWCSPNPYQLYSTKRRALKF